MVLKSSLLDNRCCPSRESPTASYKCGMSTVKALLSSANYMPLRDILHKAISRTNLFLIENGPGKPESGDDVEEI